MRKGTPVLSILNPLPIYIDLPQTRRHLCNIQVVTLGPRLHHICHTILLTQRRHGAIPRQFVRLIENPQNVLLKDELVRRSRLVLHQPKMNLRHHPHNLRLLLANRLIHLTPRLGVGNQVRHAHREAREHEEMSDDTLEGIQLLHRVLVAEIVDNLVDNVLAHALGNLAPHILARIDIQTLRVD